MKQLYQLGGENYVSSFANPIIAYNKAINLI